MIRRCNATAMCQALLERADIDAAKGFKPIHTINLKTGEERFLGVAYKRNAKDRGLMLNVCPFCRGEPGSFTRDTTPTP